VRAADSHFRSVYQEKKTRQDKKEVKKIKRRTATPRKGDYCKFNATIPAISNGGLGSSRQVTSKQNR
jgi:hypothetical protein